MRQGSCSTTSLISRSTVASDQAGRCHRAGSRGTRPAGWERSGSRRARAWRCASGAAASGILAAVLAVTILGYNAGVKHTWLGPAAMGACRGLNLLLGMTHAAALGGPVAWLAALAYGLYVSGITVASRSEATGGARGLLVAGLVVQLAAILTLAAVGCSGSRFPARAGVTRSFLSRVCSCWLWWLSSSV